MNLIHLGSCFRISDRYFIDPWMDPWIMQEIVKCLTRIGMVDRSILSYVADLRCPDGA